MEDFLDHLELSARRKIPDTPNAPTLQAQYIYSFRIGQKSTKEKFSFTCKGDRDSILDKMEHILRQVSFDLGKGPDFTTGEITARLEKELSPHRGFFASLPLGHEKLQLYLEVFISVSETGDVTITTNQNIPTWCDDFRNSLYRTLSNAVKPMALSKPDESPYPHNPILGPAEDIRTPFTGNLRDYSGCADEGELASLNSGVLPLGRYAFGKAKGLVKHGKALFLNKYRTGAPMEYNGVLICAPQNSGKTELIIRWAESANQAGYSLFIVDVKGNLKDKLAGKLNGDVFYFSTKPEPRKSKQVSNTHPLSDRINFLAGLAHDDTRNIAQLVAAIVPSEGWDKGENLYYYQNRCIWLGAIIHILKLFEFYFEATKPDGRNMDLSDLYSLVTEEQKLYDYIDAIKVEQVKWKGKDDAPLLVEHWENKISILMSTDRVYGQRLSKDSYKSLTQGIATALEPFSQTGDLVHRIRDTGPGRLFSFEQLGESKPVTIILAAREQDLEDSVTVVSMAVKKLQQFLFERMEVKNPRPVLLLLDETRRIRAFKTNEYITFAREAKAGCVVVYQSLTQCGDEKVIMEILENIGTQIYLGGLVGQTAKHFISILPKRYRQSYNVSVARGSGAPITTHNLGQSLDDYFTSNELYNIPSGEWPALVYIRDHGDKKPFMTDMDNKFFQSKAISSTASKSRAPDWA